MTDNERRAHELAVAIRCGTMRPEMLSAIGAATGQSEIHFDPYGIYKDYYSMFLPLFNRDYPDGKSRG